MTLKLNSSDEKSYCSIQEEEEDAFSIFLLFLKKFSQILYANVISFSMIDKLI
jgi:hypothetical protein